MSLFDFLKRKSSRKCSKCKERDGHFRCTACSRMFCKECCEEATKIILGLAIGNEAARGRLPSSDDILYLNGLCGEQAAICPRCALPKIDPDNPVRSARGLSRTCVHVVSVVILLLATSLTNAAQPIPAKAQPIHPQNIILGSKKPFAVNRIQLQFDAIEFGQPYQGMFAPTGMTKDQTVLSIEVKVPAKVSVDTVSAMKVWVTDKKGDRSKPGTALSSEQPKHQVVWLFAVAKSSKSFLLHFPSGETVDLTPLLR